MPASAARNALAAGQPTEVTLTAATPLVEAKPQPDARGVLNRQKDQDHLQQLAAYARMASQHRGLTSGELAEDMADRLSAIAGLADTQHRADAAGFGLARQFLETLTAAFAGSRHRIDVDCDPALRLPAAELALVGTIVSEAVTNALKHAFPGDRVGHVWVRLAQDADRLRLTIRDDGIGMPDLQVEPVSGRGLIDTLARQLGGYARLGSAPFGGALVSVIYPHTAQRAPSEVA